MRISDWSSDVCSSDLIWGSRNLAPRRGFGCDGKLRREFVEFASDRLEGREILRFEMFLQPVCFASLASFAKSQKHGAGRSRSCYSVALDGYAASNFLDTIPAKHGIDRKSTRLNSSH